MVKWKTSYLIHGFALLHVVVTAASLLLGFQDSLILTLLTMLMALLICLKRSLPVEFTAVGVILVNIVGFILGSLGAEVFDFPSEMLSRCLATFFTTELIGWALDLFARTLRPSESYAKASWKENAGWLAFAVVAVFLLRIIVEIFLFRKGPFRDADVVGLFVSFCSKSLVLLVMLSATIAFIRFGHRKGYSLDAATVGATLFVTVLCFLCALAHTLGLPFHWNRPVDPKVLSQNLVIAMLTEVTLFVITYMVEFAVNLRHELTTQRERRHLAEYRYMALKNQVNPHFLFNSLNILDSIVQDGDKEGSSRYIHKLAGIYRYMLQHDGGKLVRLSEEVTFATMYHDLLKIRFPEGFLVETDIPDEDLARMIVPCTLQLLLENVTKHNAISPEAPVHVRIHSDGSFLEVENDLVPKASPPVSSGLGLKYIRQQYLDLSGQEIHAGSDGKSFRVRIPLL